MQEKRNIKRYPFLDHLRGFTVLIMIIFHLFYDLSLFKLLEIDFNKDTFWFVYPRFIVTLFLLCVGMSLCLVHKDRVKWRKFGKRFLKLAGLALLISVVTYIFFRERWIYFGTLHCIALTSLAGLLFIRIPKIALLIGLLILIPALFFGIKIPWIVLPHLSMDYIPFFPWFGVVLIGIFLHHLGGYRIDSSKIFLKGALSFLGRHALVIYLIHQPILFGFTYILTAIFK